MCIDIVEICFGIADKQILSIFDSDLPGSSRSSLIRVHTVCIYAKIGLKSLQEYSADNINRQHFQMHVFLAFQGLNSAR